MVRVNYKMCKWYTDIKRGWEPLCYTIQGGAWRIGEEVKIRSVTIFCHIITIITEYNVKQLITEIES